ncbi:MAG: hypothetical protein AAB617_01560 [Patescibacteria group bacterium]
MKLVIVSTTINGEEGYLPYDSLAAKSKFSEVVFVIAGDTTSKPFDDKKFKCKIEYLSPKNQERFEISSLIGWKSQRRRNAAFLRALELNPDFILTIDDDNIPDPDYFESWHNVLTRPVNQVVEVTKEVVPAPWHNYLKTAPAPIEMYPRGFPMPFLWQDATEVRAIKDAIQPQEIGLFQGISLGDPDIDARTRLVYPKRLPLESIREKNYCLKNVWSPYNTQNTVYAKFIFPLALMWPFAERMDDIFHSFVFQKVLFNNDMYVHVGDAVNRQDRGVWGARNVYKNDFLTEIEGYMHGHEVWAEINAITEKDPVKFLEKLMESENVIIKRHKEYFAAHLRDINKIYGKA